MMIWIILACLLAIVVAGVANAVMDKLVHHFYDSVFSDWNRQFWDPAVSWRNKYKNYPEDRRPRFPGATTVFSFLTDGWHLAKFVMLTGIAVPATFALWLSLPAHWHTWWAWLIAYAFCRAAFAVTFHLFYHKVFDERPL